MHIRIVLALLLAFACPARAADPAPVRVAVYDLRADNVDERTAAVVTDGLIAELRKLERVSVLGMNEVRAMLTHEANKQLTGCADDSCVTEIAGALGVDNLVVGSLGKLGDSHVLNVKRIDTTKAAVVASVSKRVPVVDGQEFLSLVAPASEELFREYPLRPGLVRGVNPELVHLLNPPPLPAWVFWGTAGAGLVLGAAGAYEFSTAQGLYDEAARLERANTDSAVTLPMREEAGLRGSRAGYLLLGAGATVAIMAVEALFTDWYGYRDWRPGTPVDPAR